VYICGQKNDGAKGNKKSRAALADSPTFFLCPSPKQGRLGGVFSYSSSQTLKCLRPSCGSSGSAVPVGSGSFSCVFGSVIGEPASNASFSMSVAFSEGAIYTFLSIIISLFKFRLSLNFRMERELCRFAAGSYRPLGAWKLSRLMPLGR